MSVNVNSRKSLGYSAYLATETLQLSRYMTIRTHLWTSTRLTMKRFITTRRIIGHTQHRIIFSRNLTTQLIWHASASLKCSAIFHSLLKNETYLLYLKEINHAKITHSIRRSSLAELKKWLPRKNFKLIWLCKVIVSSKIRSKHKYGKTKRINQILV